MLLDKTLVFSEDQGLSGTSGVEASTDYIVTNTSDDYSKMWLVVKGDKGLSGVGPVSGVGGLTGVDIELETSAVSGFGSVTSLLKKSFTTAEFNAEDFLIKTRLPLGLLAFTRVKYTTDDTATRGAVTAFLTDAVSTCEIAK
jgi:hypothetical protein